MMTRRSLLTKGIAALAALPLTRALGSIPNRAKSFGHTIITWRLQHKLHKPSPEFLLLSGERGFSTKKITEEFVAALKHVEDEINNAIKEGAHEVNLSYLNILDAQRNPLGEIGHINIASFRYHSDTHGKNQRWAHDPWRDYSETALQITPITL